VQLDFWFDLSCPYAYLASQRLGAVMRERRQRIELRYRPMLLGGVFRAIGAGDGPMATLSEAKREHLRLDLARWADLVGVPLTTPAAHPMRTVRALRTLLGLPEESWPAAVHELFVAYWQRGEDITRDEVIAAALARAAIDTASIASALEASDSQERKDDLRARTDHAVELGIFGAPAFVVQDEGVTHWLWGQDRLPLVEALLDGWHPPPAPPSALAPPAAPSTPVGPAAPAGHHAVAPPSLDFYFDTSSPYSYLGLTQLARVSHGHPLRLRPILLGGLFRAIGTADVPLFSFPEAKRKYLLRELAIWAAWWDVPFRFPRKFPQRTTTAQRLVLLLADQPALQHALALALARAMWAEDRDLEDEQVLREVLHACHAPESLLAASQSPQAKSALIAATAAAADAGVFGVPTCIVQDHDGPRRFWGQDRLVFVERALAGWSSP
jgi:2-hydroxychromene-2-carboxylate isomerase